jgi:hypothetical protein
VKNLDNYPRPDGRGLKTHASISSHGRRRTRGAVMM